MRNHPDSTMIGEASSEVDPTDFDSFRFSSTAIAMASPITDQILQAYLDEALTAEQMSRIEQLLRDDPTMASKLARLVGERDAGVHSIGEIWRRHRISCPNRQQLGSYLLGAVMEDVRDYIEFHIQQIGCRYCQSNLEDLKRAQQDSQATAATRRRKYFQSSAGYLNR